MTVLETQRLLLSRLSYDHCEFIFELVNEPTFKRFIGDKDVNSLEDAREYLREGPIGGYEKFGYGLFLVTLKDTEKPAGICGLVRREEFDDPDIGFAFLRRYRRNGYAGESVEAVLEYGFGSLELRRIIAMADPDNEPSVRLLERLGFVYEREVRMPDDDQDISLFAIES
jgi:RimJ/RimL family protein N-acetyltransferase